MKKQIQLFILMIAVSFISNSQNTMTVHVNEGQDIEISLSLIDSIDFKFNAETVKDYDGNVYHTVKIGSQIWMVENLKTTKYRDGTLISIEKDLETWKNLETGAYCDYDNSDSSGIIYGHLYNWFAVNNEHKLAPSGWHIASDAEWSILTDYLGGLDNAGGKLKETGFNHWFSPNANATNTAGFSALGGGFRGNDDYKRLKSRGLFWTSTEYQDNDYAWYRNFYYDDGRIERNWGDKKTGFSVRCIKDY
jgi:uncharacterized protein (TIGR02145 family)